SSSAVVVKVVEVAVAATMKAAVAMAEVVVAVAVEAAAVTTKEAVAAATAVAAVAAATAVVAAAVDPRPAIPATTRRRVPRTTTFRFDGREASPPSVGLSRAIGRIRCAFALTPTASLFSAVGGDGFTRGTDRAGRRGERVVH